MDRNLEYKIGKNLLMLQGFDQRLFIKAHDMFIIKWATNVAAILRFPPKYFCQEETFGVTKDKPCIIRI